MDHTYNPWKLRRQAKHFSPQNASQMPDLRTQHGTRFHSHGFDLASFIRIKKAAELDRPEGASETGISRSHGRNDVPAGLGCDCVVRVPDAEGVAY